MDPAAKGRESITQISRSKSILSREGLGAVGTAVWTGPTFAPASQVGLGFCDNNQWGYGEFQPTGERRAHLIAITQEVVKTRVIDDVRGVNAFMRQLGEPERARTTTTRDRDPSPHHRRPAVGLAAPVKRNPLREHKVHREPQAGDGGHREGQPPTPRQLEVFQTVARSRSRADAADALGITEQSIKNQFSHLFRRLGVGGELQAAWVLWGRKVKR